MSSPAFAQAFRRAPQIGKPLILSLRASIKALAPPGETKEHKVPGRCARAEVQHEFSGRQGSFIRTGCEPATTSNPVKCARRVFVRNDQSTAKP